MSGPLLLRELPVVPDVVLAVVLRVEHEPLASALLCDAGEACGIVGDGRPFGIEPVHISGLSDDLDEVVGEPLELRGPQIGDRVGVLLGLQFRARERAPAERAAALAVNRFRRDADHHAVERDLLHLADVLPDERRVRAVPPVLDQLLASEGIGRGEDNRRNSEPANQTCE